MELVDIHYWELLHYKIEDLGVRKIIVKLIEYLIKEFEMFTTSVVVRYPALRTSYNIYIEYPCDLTKMKDRLLDKSPVKYKYIGQIIRDFELIASNCEIFNKNNVSFLQNASRFRQYYFWIFPKMLSRVGYKVEGTYREMIIELSKYFPLDSPMSVDGELYPISNTRVRDPTEDCASLLYAHIRRLPESWQSALIWGVVLIADATQKYKISSTIVDIDITDIPEAYTWLRGQLIKFQRLISSGRNPENIPTWQEEAHLTDRLEYEEENSDTIEKYESENCSSLGSDQMSLPEMSDDVLEVKEEVNSRRRRR